MSPGESYAILRGLAHERGAVGFGGAELSGVSTDDFLLPGDLLKRLPFAVSVAIRLLPEVLSTLEDHPNHLYEHHYRQVNFALDRLALELANRTTELGGRAMPIPASQLVDWENQRGHLSHKRVAIAAGLGWLGRNNLLVTPSHGAQVRLVTVLTDLPPRDMTEMSDISDRVPMETACGSCHACVAACPAHAIGETPAEFKHQDCFAMLKEFQRRRFVSQYICGLCVSACSGRTAR